MKSSEPLRGFSGSRRYTLTVIPPLPGPVTTALAAGRLTHALCLEAPSPALLRDTAIALAGALLCRSGDGNLCGTCPACRKVLVGEHPDLMLYDPDEDKDIYKKESLRRLRAELYRTPVEAPRKVAILQLAERIPAEGQNLLLKIIEEPPEDTFFVFTAQNRYRLLPTVLSRVTCYTLPPAAPADCLRRMKELAPGHTEEELNRALLRCGGSPETGAALLKDPAVQKRYAAAEEMLAGLAMANPYRAIAAAAPLEKDRAGYTALLETLAELLANPALREMYNLPGRAGCQKVLNLHGTIYDNECPRCGRKYSMEYIRDAKRVPLCEDCMAVIRPKVLLFGEQVDNRMMTAAAEEIAKADVLLLLGTSIGSGLCERYVKYFEGETLIIINAAEHFTDAKADIVLREEVKTALPKIVL